ncbi:hypothetical protein SDC9_107699 [bioreactor metagenome]|uniref:Uncharacterized protein n=1 Tax=bioreactor metagenome TaxID=1076179 RepID=A0A645B5Y6_9ZZZZ
MNSRAGPVQRKIHLGQVKIRAHFPQPLIDIICAIQLRGNTVLRVGPVPIAAFTLLRFLNQIFLNGMYIFLADFRTILIQTLEKTVLAVRNRLSEGLIVPAVFPALVQRQKIFGHGPLQRVCKETVRTVGHSGLRRPMKG